MYLYCFILCLVGLKPWTKFMTVCQNHTPLRRLSLSFFLAHIVKRDLNCPLADGLIGLPQVRLQPKTGCRPDPGAIAPAGNAHGERSWMTL